MFSLFYLTQAQKSIKREVFQITSRRVDTRLRRLIENRKRFGTPSYSNEDENAAVIGENDKLGERVVFLHVWDA